MEIMRFVLDAVKSRVAPDLVFPEVIPGSGMTREKLQSLVGNEPSIESQFDAVMAGRPFDSRIEERGFMSLGDGRRVTIEITITLGERKLMEPDHLASGDGEPHGSLADQPEG